VGTGGFLKAEVPRTSESRIGESRTGASRKSQNLPGNDGIEVRNRNRAGR
jgi:hypothetical protein